MDAAKIKDVLAKVVAPLLAKDGAELYLVKAEGNEIVLHYAGAYAGCPGAHTITKNIVMPVLQKVVPEVRVTANSGSPVPKGAERLGDE